ncbi:MAG: hypothetical protein CMM50_01220 [Rhodospirillaceae bacterium]|nr:hypothetical protein [Rhodospirillaceae bacterium]
MKGPNTQFSASAHLPLPWNEPTDWYSAVQQNLAWPLALTPWETGFLLSIAQRVDLTPRQAGKLEQITNKVRAFVLAEQRKAGR